MVKYDPVLGAFRTIDDGSQNSGGAANITVNGISPDPEGNIQLNAENISFSSKNSMGEDFPCSASISRENLQVFFESMQYAIFSVNGHCAYIDPSNPIAVQGDISIYGDTMFLETPGNETPMQDWDGNPLNEKTVYNLAYDLYTYGIRKIMINGDGSQTYWPDRGTADLDLTAEKIDVYRNYDPDGFVQYRYTAMNALVDMNWVKMEIPEYGDITSTDEMGESYDSTMVTHYAPCNGWLIIEWCSDSLKDDSYVEIGGVQFHLGTVSEAGGLAWRQFIFPIASSTEWFIYDDEVRSYRVRFLPCSNIVNLYGE